MIFSKRAHSKASKREGSCGMFYNLAQSWKLPRYGWASCLRTHMLTRSAAGCCKRQCCSEGQQASGGPLHVSSTSLLHLQSIAGEPWEHAGALRRHDQSAQQQELPLSTANAFLAQDATRIAPHSLGGRTQQKASWVRRSLTLRPRMMPTATTWPATRQRLSQEEASASIFSSSSMAAIPVRNPAKAYLQRVVLGKQASFAVRKAGAHRKPQVQSAASTAGAQEMTGIAVEVSPIVPRYSTSVAVKPAGSPVLRPESFPCSLSPGLASLLALGVRPKRPAARKMVVDATTICKHEAVMPAALHWYNLWCWAWCQSR